MAHPPTPTPTESGLPKRAGDFATLTDALDYAALGASGIDHYSGRGELVAATPYARLRELALAAGGRLLAAGLRPGDRALLIADSDPDFACAFMGCLYARLIPLTAPMPQAFGDRAAYLEQIRRLAETAGARAAIAPAGFAGWVEEAMQGLDLAFVGPLAALDARPERLPAGAPDPDALAYLQFSSGTTSFPKGVAITHRAMMANIAAMVGPGLALGPEDRAVNWLPMYHDMGLVGFFMATLASQTTCDYVTTRDFIRRPGLWTGLMSRNGGSVTFSPSFGYRLAAMRGRGAEGLDLSRLRIAGVGGDMVKPGDLAAFAAAFAPAGYDPRAFLPCFGMAEATLGLTFSPRGRGLRTVTVDLERLQTRLEAGPPGPGAAARDFALCGPALPGHAVEIRDAAGAALPAGRVGRIHVRGAGLMRGYYNAPEETRAALSADGWLDTGDLGYLHEGELVVTGRAKDLIIVNGRNIWPQDIEWAVERAVARVRGVAAFSVAPDRTDREEELAVVVECRPADGEERRALRARVEGLVRERFGLGATVALTAPGELPRTSSGKLSRARAREMLAAGAFGP